MPYRTASSATSQRPKSASSASSSARSGATLIASLRPLDQPALAGQVQSLGARFVELSLETGDAEDSGGYTKAQSEEFYTRLAFVVAMIDVVGGLLGTHRMLMETFLDYDLIGRPSATAVIVAWAASLGSRPRAPLPWGARPSPERPG